MGAIDNKRIAKNSLFLYIQMAIRMIVALYTTRVVLQALGFVDFGLNNVVGGFVSMFTFISETMVSASQRFFAYEIGKGDTKRLNEYFNTTVLCYIFISVALVIIVEGFGVWFVNYKMEIPGERLYASNWVFQFAVISMVVHMFMVPYTSMIIAQEKMIVFAIITLIDAFLKLGIVYILMHVKGDRLIVYAAMLLILSLINFLIYVFYCRSKFYSQTKFKLSWNKSLFVELISYSGWSLFWTSANVVRSQGINILLNLFSNPVVNSARGIAYQVNTAINQFVNSFYQAVRPHITKLSARKEYDEMMKMVFSSTKISFLLMSLITVPFLIKTPYILELWLGDFPEYSITFTRLVIITALIDTLGHPLTTAVCSTGNIKWFHVVCGSILLLNLPVSYLFLKLGYDMYVVFYVSIAMSSFAQIARVVFVKYMFNMNAMKYFTEVFFKSIATCLLSIVAAAAISLYFTNSFWDFCLWVVLSLMISAILSFYVGASRIERNLITDFVMKKIKRTNG